MSWHKRFILFKKIRMDGWRKLYQASKWRRRHDNIEDADYFMECTDAGKLRIFGVMFEVLRVIFFAAYNAVPCLEG